MSLYMYFKIILCMLSYMCDFYLLFSVAGMRAIRDTFIQVLVANTQYFVPQAILDFLPNFIQTYQYISCVHCITVHLYSFENHILVITQQFLVLYEGVQQKVCWLSQLQANLIIMSYHFIKEDPGTYMWTGCSSVLSDGYYHPATTM